MSAWNFDLTHIPREGDIWAATHKGEVIRTRYFAKSKTVKEPFWAGVGAEDRILAWQPYVRPEHPFAGKDEARTELAGIMATVSGADFLPMIDDCGSGA